MEEVGCLKVCPTPEELSTVCSRVKCPQVNCTAFFQSASNLNMHLIKHHKVTNDGLTKKKETQFFCPTKSCPYFKDSTKFFTKLKYLKQHFLKVHALKKFICSKCDKKFPTEAFKTSHMKNCGKLYTCTCGSNYTSTEAILTHCKRKGEGHLFVEKSDKVVKSQGNNLSQVNEASSRKPERLIYPKLSCDNVSFPIHYIAAIALSELSAPQNHSKLIDKGIQTDTGDFPVIKLQKPNVGIQKMDKKRKNSQHTQTTGKIKQLKISAQTQTNSDYLKQKVKSNLKTLLRKRKKSMETQTKDHSKGENNVNLIKSNWEKQCSYQLNEIDPSSLRDKKSFISEMEKNTDSIATLEKEKAGKWLWDNNFFTQRDTPEIGKGSESKNELFVLGRELNLCNNKEVNLNEYNHLSQKEIATQYSSEEGSDSQIFDLNRLCNIETQTEIDTFLTECDDDTFTLCSTTETQTPNDFDHLLYSNMCTQTCDEVDELFNFNFVNIETQTTWPDLTGCHNLS